MHTQRVASHGSARGIDLTPMLDLAISLSIFFSITARRSQP